MARTEELKVPSLGESVSEATIAKWIKKAGDSVKEDETLVELETDKVTVEVNAPFSGTLTEIKALEGQTVVVGDLLGTVEEGAVSAKPEEKKVEAPAPAKVEPKEQPTLNLPLSPSVRRMVDEEQVDVTVIPATGKDGRVTKEDLVNFLSQTPAPAQVQTQTQTQTQTSAPVARAPITQQDNLGREERVPMSRLRQTIALRLKEAQQTAAILTTFNEIDMTAVMDVRNRLKDKFEEKYGIKLGFMSFFVKAAVEALKEIPDVNASIDGLDMV